MADTSITNFMVENPVSVNPGMNLYEAAQQILDHQVSGVTVVDDAGKLVGMLSELDCLRAMLTSVYNGAEPGGALVSEIMTHQVDVNQPDQGILEVATSMLASKHRRRPVVKDGELIGQVTCRQILKGVIEMTDDTVIRQL